MAPTSTDPRSGFCSETKTFHSIRPPVSLPPVSLPLSFTAYAFSLLPSPLPSHPAFIDASSGVSLSYLDLVSRVESLAFSLRSELGISKGDVAFILSPPRLEILILYFALFSIGAVAAPANPAATSAELSRQIRLACPSVFFSTSAAAAHLPRHVNPILIDSSVFGSFLESACPLTDRVQVWQSDPAAILFSSGTTGWVKGVVLSHRNIIAETASFISFLRSRQRQNPTVQMVTAPPFHAYGMVFSVKGVVVGETTLIQTERFDPEEIIRAVGRFGVTHLALAPPALLWMVRVCEENGGGGWKRDLSSLEVISCGGAPCSPDLIRRFIRKFRNVALSQGYGLTESTSGVFRSIGLEESWRIGSCGRIMPNCEAKIVDPDSGVPLPPFVHGEILLRGETIMRGYLGDEEATSAVLNSEGWLRTGDLGYIDDDGFLFVIDRLKELIKYKGFQVPPAELEHLLQGHPDIIEAAVIPYPDEEAGQIPMAFIVRKPHSTLSEDQVMEFVKKQVASYKKIRRVAFVDSIPRNAAGKILRRNLVHLATSGLNAKL